MLLLFFKIPKICDCWKITRGKIEKPDTTLQALTTNWRKKDFDERNATCKWNKHSANYFLRSALQRFSERNRKKLLKPLKKHRSGWAACERSVERAKPALKASKTTLFFSSYNEFLMVDHKLIWTSLDARDNWWTRRTKFLMKYIKINGR